MAINVSIIIPHYCGQFLGRSLAAIFDSEQQVNFEVIVVLDSDAAPLPLCWLDRGVKQVVLEKGKRGFGVGCNLGARLASGDYLLFLNDDALLTAGCLSPLVSELERDPSVGVTGPKLRSLKNEKRFDYSGACGGFLDGVGIPFARGRIFGSIEEDTGQYDTPLDAFWVSGACLMIRRHLFESIGGFFEGFYMQMEEVDLCWVAQSMGYRVRCIPQSFVWHHGGFTLPEDSLLKAYLNHRNNLVMLMRNLPLSEWPRLLARISLEVFSTFWALYRPREWRHSMAALICLLSFPLLLRAFFSRSPIARVPLAKLQGYLPQSVAWLYYAKGLKTFRHLTARRADTTTESGIVQPLEIPS